MIPALYAPTVDVSYYVEAEDSETPYHVPESWTKHLLGYLPDCITCTHTEVRNGSYELDMDYPDTGLNADRIAVDCILQVASPDPTMGEEELPMFRIYKVERSLGGTIHVYARHISEMLSYMLMPGWHIGEDWYYPTTTLSQLMIYVRYSGGNVGRQGGIPFYIYSRGIPPSPTDLRANFSMTVPASLKTYMGGGELPAPDRSFLQVWGGEYEYRGWSIILHASRGKDEGYEIRYGHNINGITIDEDVDGIYTALKGYYQSDDTVVTGDLVYSPYRMAFPYDRAAAHDVSSEFQTGAPTVAQINAAVQAYIERNNIGNPVRMVDVDIVQVEKTTEFKGLTELSNLLLCDTATLIYNRNGVNINAKMKVTELTYDVLRERTTNIKLGTIQRTIASELAKNTQWRIYNQY